MLDAWRKASPFGIYYSASPSLGQALQSPLQASQSLDAVRFRGKSLYLLEGDGKARGEPSGHEASLEVLRQTQQQLASKGLTVAFWRYSRSDARSDVRGLAAPRRCCIFPGRQRLRISNALTPTSGGVGASAPVGQVFDIDRLAEQKSLHLVTSLPLRGSAVVQPFPPLGDKRRIDRIAQRNNGSHE